MASSTAKGPAARSCSSRTRSSAPSTVSHSSRTRTAHSGLIRATRSASTAAFDRPTVSLSEWSCRFVFEMHTSSRSISVSAPTPLRASASTAHEPTPPRPITHTDAARRLDWPALPSIRAVPPKRNS